MKSKVKAMRLSGLLVVFFSILLNAVFSMAAPVEGPSGDAFYSVPNPLPAGAHGDLIRYVKADLTPPEAPYSHAWKVMYHTTDALNQPIVSTGSVFVPTCTYAEEGERPVLLYNVGTHGLAQRCAPSYQLEIGMDYEIENITQALNKGYIVLITDYPGFTTGDVPLYMVGKACGYSILDIYNAAFQIPDIQISQEAPVAMWGFSQGGMTTCWAGQLQPTYAPDMNLVGVAAGGIPADFFEIAPYLDGHNGSSYLLETVIGLWTQYPDGIPLEELVNEEGEEAVEIGLNTCVFEAMFEFMNTELSTFVKDNMPLDELIAIPSVNETLRAQNLGGSAMDVPALLYHGTADEFIPLEQSLVLKETYCDLGMDVQYLVFPGVEHAISLFQAGPHVLSWISDRIQGKRAPSSCLTLKPRPVADNMPVDGDFLFPIREWKLDAMVHLAELDQTVYMPEESTFSAQANITQGMMVGNIDIPTFKAPIKVVLPLKVELSVIPVGETTGAAALDTDAILHLDGMTYANIAVTGIGVSRLTAIPIDLITEEPVAFPILLDKPLSCLGAGKAVFEGDTTFPPMTGGAFDTLFTAMMSGPGQHYKFTIIPQEPSVW